MYLDDRLRPKRRDNSTHATPNWALFYWFVLTMYFFKVFYYYKMVLISWEYSSVVEQGALGAIPSPSSQHI